MSERVKRHELDASSVYLTLKPTERTLYALRSDDVGGLMRRILHPGTGDTELLHDAVQEPLDVRFRHLVHRAETAGWSPAELHAQEKPEEP